MNIENICNFDFYQANRIFAKFLDRKKRVNNKLTFRCTFITE